MAVHVNCTGNSTHALVFQTDRQVLPVQKPSTRRRCSEESGEVWGMGDSWQDRHYGRVVFTPELQSMLTLNAYVLEHSSIASNSSMVCRKGFAEDSAVSVD